ncbi:Inner membrane transport protein YnfM [Devosia equisanguinis]|uniref:Inner membrane transport protein YnfM n=1 Tax=Devosia equisanguinis TaxID=2490941 RepID=A0A447IE67_9HYPH|nr:MFS transporter [Devosia equisanguinis]VDS05748.1 Inner membrane transport protein YnfM [Devosia equisanguinis]
MTSLAIRRGTPAFIRANVAFFLSAFSVFASLYSVQPLLPMFAQYWVRDAGTASLALSATTATMALALIPASLLADRLGRRTLIVGALLLTAILGCLLPFTQVWWQLITLRTLMGISLAGVPAVAMVYLSEEMDADALGYSMGLYIGGTAIGGMAGRVISGVLSDFLGWRLGTGILAGLILVAAIAVAVLLPQPRQLLRDPIRLGELWRRCLASFSDAALPWLFASSFLLMGGFVTLYNYAGFRLALPPFALSHSAVAAIFLVYLLGSASSTWAGALSQRLGRRKVFWALVAMQGVGVVITAVPSTPVVIAGLGVATMGFFAAHGVASAWVTRRARIGKAQASAIYLVAYYLGASILGTLGGFAWTRWGWPGVMLVSGGAAFLALLAAIRLVFIAPLSMPESTPEPTSMD